jgi:hypothetical protein
MLSAGHIVMQMLPRAANAFDRTQRLAAALVECIADRNLRAGFDHQSRAVSAPMPRRLGYQRRLAVEPVDIFPRLLVR